MTMNVQSNGHRPDFSAAQELQKIAVTFFVKKEKFPYILRGEKVMSIALGVHIYHSKVNV
jgi:hypothetical protein